MTSPASQLAPGTYDLHRQTALVTGGAQGLGVGIAEQLARCGAAVHLGDVQDGKAQTAATRLRQDGLDVTAVRVDIADSRSVDDAVAAIAARSGRLDILVTSAGVGQTVTPIVELSDAEWNRVLGVTLT